MPVPNGFDDLVRAAASIQYPPNTGDAIDAKTSEERRSLLASNAPVIRLVREGLAKEMRVMTTNDMTSSLPLDQSSALKNLAQLLVVEATVAREDGNPTNLLNACMDLYDLGCEGTRGGLIIHGLVGVAIRSMACKSTIDILRSEDAALCRRAAKHLFQAMTNAPTASDYFANEDAWRKQTPAGRGIRGLFYDIFLSGMLKPAKLKSVQRFNLQRQTEAELLSDLAAAAFRLEHQRAATNWTELVPEYLPEIPRNATNNAPLPLL